MKWIQEFNISARELSITFPIYVSVFHQLNYMNCNHVSSTVANILP